jgi:hypothetical protein
MREQSQHQKIIELIKIKQWYIPADSRSYDTLRSINVPKLKIHRDFLPTLKLATSIHHVRATSVDFNIILGSRLDLMGSKWKSKKGRNCRLTDKRLVFLAPCSELNRKAIASLEGSFAKFCTRWGFKCVSNYSEQNDRLKLVLDYEFDPARNPVIDESDQIETKDYELVLGNTKFNLTFGHQKFGKAFPPLTRIEIFDKAGTIWKSVHTGTCVDQQIGDLSQFLIAMSNLFDRRVLVEENRNPDSVIVRQQAKPSPRPEVVSQLRELTKSVETNILDLTLTTDNDVKAQKAQTLVSIARKLPSLNLRLEEAKIDLQINRQMLIQHLSSAEALWPHLLSSKMSPDKIDQAATEAWPRLQRIENAWLKTEFEDHTHGTTTLLDAASI